MGAGGGECSDRVNRRHVLQFQRLHRLRLQVHHADAVGVRVGHVQRVAQDADAGRLVEHRLLALLRRPAQERHHRPAGQVDHLQLAVVSVGHEQRAVLVQCHAERVLQQRFGRLPLAGVGHPAGAVAVAEVEQPAADERAHLARPVHRHRADRADLGVGHEQRLAVAGEPARLGELGLGVRAVLQVLVRIAGERAELLRLQVVQPDLVRAGHGDEQLLPVQPHVPRCQLHRPRGALQGERAVRAGERGHRLRFHVEYADAVVLAVGHVHRVAVNRHALRVVELGLVEGAVRLARRAGPGDGQLLAVQVGDNNAVVRAVGDEQPLALAVGHHLAGEVQGRVGAVAELGRVEPQGRLVEGLVLLVLHDERVHDLGGALEVHRRLARRPGDRLPGGVDDDDGRPPVHVVGGPDLLVGVVHHRVLEFVPQHRLPQRLVVLLVVELRAVNADHHHLVRVLLLQFGQLLHDVHAVDAAEGPEVEDDDLPLQIFDGERLAGVDPVGAAVQFGGGDRLFEHHLGGGTADEHQYGDEREGGEQSRHEELHRGEGCADGPSRRGRTRADTPTQ